MDLFLLIAIIVATVANVILTTLELRHGKKLRAALGEIATNDRFRKMVERIAEWSDDEITVVSPEQVRHVAQVVRDGADPIYPPFGHLAA